MLRIVFLPRDRPIGTAPGTPRHQLNTRWPGGGSVWMCRGANGGELVVPTFGIPAFEGDVLTLNPAEAAQAVDPWPWIPGGWRSVAGDAADPLVSYPGSSYTAPGGSVMTQVRVLTREEAPPDVRSLYDANMKAFGQILNTRTSGAGSTGSSASSPTACTVRCLGRPRP